MFYPLVLAGLMAVASAGTVPNADTIAVCNDLVKKYPNYVAWDTLGPNALQTAGNASVYTDINSIYWNRANSANRAACAFFPENVAQVSYAIKSLIAHGKAPFAMKSGGHQPAVGFSSTDGGVIISFEPNLAKTERTADGKHFVIGMGARWGDVYQETIKTNQIVVGGRLAHIGVGGLTLGGGLSYYSAQYGLACDNVDNFEAVLANGTIVNANRTSNPDLWWALRGGGNQFAAVTRITTQAHPAGVDGKIWGGIRAFDPSQRHALFRAMTNFIRDYPDKKAAVIPTFQFGLPGNLLNAIKGPIFFMFYDGPDPGKIFAEFDAIPSLFSTTATKNYYQMSQEAGGAALNGFGNSFRVDTVPNLPADQMVEFFDGVWNLTYKQSLDDNFKNLDVQLLGIDPQPLSARIARASQAQGGNALGLNPDHGDRVWIENDLVWLNPACDSTCPEYSRTLSDDILDFQKKQFAGVPATNHKSGDIETTNYNPLFLNDAAPYQDPYTSYGPANLARLKSVKAAYDPTGFFTNRQGGFKLPA